jgi:hypothetical protein
VRSANAWQETTVSKTSTEGWVAGQIVAMQQAAEDSAIESVLAGAERLLAQHDRNVWGVVTVAF